MTPDARTPDHVILVGAAGTGKTTLAREATRWLSAEYDLPEARYIARVAERPAPMVDKPPFRAPHHTCSAAALLGTVRNGWRWQPGELSLAHGGVLFLDELPEFSTITLNTVAHAMVHGCIEYADRTGVNLVVPTRFRLIGAMNECPCGAVRADRCACTQAQIDRYMARVPAVLRKLCRIVPVHGCAQFAGAPI